MSERIRTAGSPQEGLTPEDIRRRLEGRAEVLEAARARYATLESVLGRRRWKHRLRARPGLVAEWLAQEPAVTEALARTTRRAEAEGWPEDTPVRAAVRELAARRARLESLARRRLAELAPVSGDASLERDLPRLDALVRQRASLTLSPGEVLVFEGQRQRRGGFRSWRAARYVLLLYLLFLLSILAVRGRLGPLGPALLVVLFVLPLVGVAMRSGRVWLTSERLVWQPVLGEPVAVPLASIPEGGVRLEPATGGVRVEGERRALVRHQVEADYLAALVEMHRQPPLRGAARAGVRLAEVAIYPAVLHEGSVRRGGHAVLRPDRVSFIPEGSGAAALQSLTGHPVDLPMEQAWVLEQLRWLQDTEFDACLARVVEATGGLSWSAWEAGLRRGTSVWKEIRISLGGRELVGHVDWTQQSATERVLRSWPQASGPGRA